MSGFLLAEMTWPEVAAARERAPLALVPVGSCEQHGPHLALQTDAVRAWEFTKRLAERLDPRAVVAPLIPVGVSEHHMAFPGTLTLDPITFQQVVYELVRSLYRHGWRRVFVVNGHGGNDAALGVLMTRLMADFPDLGAAWSGITAMAPDVVRTVKRTERTGHSCEVEASQAMYLAPHLVRADRLTAGQIRPEALNGNADGGKIHLAQRYERITANGALGDARYATSEAGREIVETALDRVQAFLERFLETPDGSPDDIAGPVRAGAEA